MPLTTGSSMVERRTDELLVNSYVAPRGRDVPYEGGDDAGEWTAETAGE
jgi:hypothetical protein